LRSARATLRAAFGFVHAASVVKVTDSTPIDFYERGPVGQEYARLTGNPRRLSAQPQGS
jgi:hypothetical protein